MYAEAGSPGSDVGFLIVNNDVRSRDFIAGGMLNNYPQNRNFRAKKKSHSDGTFLYYPDVCSYALLARDTPPSNRMEGGTGRKFQSCTIKIPTSIFFAVYSALFIHDSQNTGTLLYRFDVCQA